MSKILNPLAAMTLALPALLLLAIASVIPQRPTTGQSDWDRHVARWDR